MRDENYHLHIFFTCPTCGLLWTNLYHNDDWKRHASDLEDAKDNELICEHCLNGVETQPEERDPSFRHVAYLALSEQGKHQVRENMLKDLGLLRAEERNKEK